MRLNIDWFLFKFLINDNRIQWKYIETANSYFIYGIENSFQYVTEIAKDNGPDQLEFELTYKNIITSNINTLTSIDILGSKEEIHVTTPLLANEEYIAPWINITKCSMFTVMLFSDQPSATDGVQFQWSCDATEIGILSDNHNLVANKSRAFSLTPRSTYFRLKYTNSGIDQTVWKCCIHTHVGGTGLITRPLSKDLDSNNYAQTVRSVIDGLKSDGSFEHLQSDDSGRLKVAADIVGGSSNQYSAGDSQIGIKGNVVIGTDGTLLRIIRTDTNGDLLLSDTQLELSSIIGEKGFPMMGSDGSSFRWLKLDGSGSLVVAAAPTANTFFSFGDVATAATTIRAVYRTTYIEPTLAAQRSIASSNANDSSAGTGARQIKITYYDNTGDGPFTEILTMNGTTPVNTTNINIRFIEKMEVIAVGSTASNIGIITLFGSTGGTGGTIGTIAATNNQTFWCHHYVALGKTMKVTGISVSHNGTTVGSGALYVLKSFATTVSNSPEIQIADFVRLYGQSSTFSRDYNSPIKVIGPARITMYVTPESSSSFTYRAAFDFFEE